MPPDLVPQIGKAIEFCTLSGLPYLQIPGVEADDTMGSIAKSFETKETLTFLCSSDKDLCQLVSERTRLILPHKSNLIVDREQVKALFDVYPEQMIDYLAIVGDASDNIPGIAGFGAKTAASLLSTYGSLDALLHAADTLTAKKKELLLQGKASALLSRQLATIDTTIPLPQEASFFHRAPPREEALKAFYKDMHFSSLITELETPKTPQRAYHLVNDEQALHTLVDTLSKQPQICIDTTTSSLHPLSTELIGIGLGYATGEAYYIPLNGTLEKRTVLSLLKPLFTHPHIGWIGHHMKSVIEILQAEGAPLLSVAFDTLIASYLVSPHIQRHSLDELILEKWNVRKLSLSQLVGKGKQEKTLAQVPIDLVCSYSCENVDYTMRLAHLFHSEIASLGLTDVFHTIEIPLISTLARMETRGIFCDPSILEKISHELSLKLNALQSAIYACAGEPFNISSPKQLSYILFEKMGVKPSKKTTTGFSTAADVLESLQAECPLAQKVLDYRTLEKLRSTYVEALPEQMHPTSRRIHCAFDQSVAATGRLSCHHPNLQNIPVRTEVGRRIRSAFKPQEPDASFLSADYSQIELRLLAHFSEDPHLLKAFHHEEDVHTYTASLIFNTPLSQVSPSMRHLAKTVNFGILYGQQAFGLSKILNIDYNEAHTFIETYFQRYPQVKDFLESCKERARNTGRAVTLTGRQRPIPDIHSTNPQLRAAAERLAMNTPLQGTAADLIKIAMIRIDALLQKETDLGHMILQIHDELLFESPDAHIHALSCAATQIMEGVFDLKVPLLVHISIGKNWGEC